MIIRCCTVQYVMHSYSCSYSEDSTEHAPTEALHHARVLALERSLRHLLLRRLRQLEHERRLAEAQVLRRDEAVEEDVDAYMRRHYLRLL